MIYDIQEYIYIYIKKGLTAEKKERFQLCRDKYNYNSNNTCSEKCAHIIELLIIENVTGHSTLHNLGDSIGTKLT